MVAKNILAGFPFLQDPGGVLDNVTQVLASKGALSTTSIQNRFDKCTDAAAGAWGADLSHSQALSVLQVSDLEMPGSGIHYALFRNFCKLLTVQTPWVLVLDNLLVQVSHSRAWSVLQELLQAPTLIHPTETHPVSFLPDENILEEENFLL